MEKKKGEGRRGNGLSISRHADIEAKKRKKKKKRHHLEGQLIIHEFEAKLKKETSLRKRRWNLGKTPPNRHRLAYRA